MELNQTKKEAIQKLDDEKTKLYATLTNIHKENA